MRPNHQQARDHAQEAEGVDQEAAGHPDERDRQAADRRADQPRGVEAERVEGDGVREILGRD